MRSWVGRGEGGKKEEIPSPFCIRLKLKLQYQVHNVIEDDQCPINQNILPDIQEDGCWTYKKADLNNNK